MKTILLIRHAKSSWENFAVTDEERPLNERGKKNAPEMAKRLRKKKIAIDVLMSSPAKRALSTANYFAQEFDIAKKDIIVVPELYLATTDAFINAIQSAPSTASTIALFSHNNGITDFANSLTDARIDNMPTCGVFAVHCAIDEWPAFEAGGHKFYFFDYPKNISG